MKSRRKAGREEGRGGEESPCLGGKSRRGERNHRRMCKEKREREGLTCCAPGAEPARRLHTAAPPALWPFSPQSHAYFADKKRRFKEMNSLAQGGRQERAAK